MTSGYRHIGVQAVEEHIWEVRIERPKSRNSLTMEVLDELADALDAAVSAGARAIILSGEGKSFCAGADLYSVHNPELGAKNEVGFGSARLWEHIARVEVPVIAAVQGHAITGGLHLAVCCDFIVAADDAVFQDTHAKLGLVPGSGEPQRISRRVGISVAREILLTSRRFTASQLRDFGLVTRVVPEESLRDVALELAREMSGNNPRAVRYIKQMLNQGLGRSYGDAQWEDQLLNWGGQLNANPDDDARARLKGFRERTGVRGGDK